uniref:TPR Domain containing protein, putative n=1 Tax=Neospora caninum (strain Liverpool) TaxID=572307 RepID=A0A0F7UEE7_NEOCL|nr:TPA: TPR Domain containing protein, putative [Neospora caninum Liverpool]
MSTDAQQHRSLEAPENPVALEGPVGSLRSSPPVSFASLSPRASASEIRNSSSLAASPTDCLASASSSLSCPAASVSLPSSSSSEFAPADTGQPCVAAAPGSTHAARTAALLRMIFPSSSPAPRSCPFIPFRSSTSHSTSSASSASSSVSSGAFCGRVAPTALASETGSERAELSPGCLPHSERVSACASGPCGSRSEQRADEALKALQVHLRQHMTMETDEENPTDGRKSLYASFASDSHGEEEGSRPPQHPSTDPANLSKADGPSPPFSSLPSSASVSSLVSSSSASSSSSVPLSACSVPVETGSSPLRNASVDGTPTGGGTSSSSDGAGKSATASRSLSPLIATLRAKMQNISGDQKEPTQPVARGLSLPLSTLPGTAQLVTIRRRGASGSAANPSEPPEGATHGGEEDSPRSPSGFDDSCEEAQYPACTEQALRALLEEWPVVPADVSEAASERERDRRLGRAASNGEQTAAETSESEERERKLSLFDEFHNLSRLSRRLLARLRLPGEAEAEGDGERETEREGEAKREERRTRERVGNSLEDAERCATEERGKKATPPDPDRAQPAARDGCDAEVSLRAFDAAVNELLTTERAVTDAMRQSFFAAYRPLPPAPPGKNLCEQRDPSSSPSSSSPASSAASASSSSSPYSASWSVENSAETAEAASLFAFMSSAQSLARRVDGKFNREASQSRPQPEAPRLLSPPSQRVAMTVRHINEGFTDMALWLLGSAHTGAWREGLLSELAVEGGCETVQEASGNSTNMAQTSSKERDEERDEERGESKAREEIEAQKREAETAQLQRLKNAYIGIVRKLQRLEPDELVEGCFIIDKIVRPEEIRRSVVFGRQGRREFLQALDGPGVVVRGWVVRCDSDRALLLVRLVAAELYPVSPPHSPVSASPSRPAYGVYADKPTTPRGMQLSSVSPVSPTAPVPQPVSATRRRLLRAECDIGSSGIYGALPLTAVGRYECKAGQASGCVSRFVPVGTAVRACVTDFLPPPRDPGRQRPSRWDERQREERDAARVDEATLNEAHAHLLLTLNAPACLTAADAAVPLQKPLGFVASTRQDALCLRCQYDDYLPIVPLQPPTLDAVKSLSCGSEGEPAESSALDSTRKPNSSLSWWDGGASLLRARLPFILFGEPRMKNSGALGHKLRVLDLLRTHFFSFSLGAGACSPARAWRQLEAAAETELGERREAARKRERERQALWRERHGAAETPEQSAQERESGGKTPQETGFRGLGTFLTEEQSSQWAQQRLQQGVSAARKGDLNTAMECYEAALLLKPKYADALVARGAAHANRLAYEKALDDLDAALGQEPQHPNAIKYRRIVLQRMENRHKEGATRSALGSRHTGSRTPSPTVTRASRTPPHKGDTVAAPSGFHDAPAKGTVPSGFHDAPAKGTVPSGFHDAPAKGTIPSGFHEAPRWGGQTAFGSRAGGAGDRRRFEAAAAAAVASAAAAANAIAVVAAEKDFVRLLAKQREEKHLAVLRQQKEALLKQQMAHAVELEQRAREKRSRAEEDGEKKGKKDAAHSEDKGKKKKKSHKSSSK